MLRINILTHECEERGEREMKKLFKMLMGMVMFAFVMMLPSNKQAAAALTPITLLQVNSPSQMESSFQNDDGFLFHCENFSASYDYYTFTIKERGWVVFYSTESSTATWGLSNLSKDKSFKSTIDDWEDKNIYGAPGSIRRYYLDPGQYYLRASITFSDWVFDMYGYYIPNSAFFTTQLQNKNCNEKTLTLNNKVSFTNSALVTGVLPLADVYRDDVNTSFKTAYGITKNNEYTIFVENYSTEWKDYNFMKSFSVTDIGKHLKTANTISKASFTKDGKIVAKCNACQKTISTRILYKASKIAFDPNGRTYNGKALKPKVILYDRNGNVIPANYYTYKATFTNNKSIGQAKAKVTLTGSFYTGTKSTTFEIIPPATKIDSITAGKNKLTVRWKKVSGASGYKILVSTDKKFAASKTKTISVSGGSKTSKSITDLKSNKRYYVKVRAYKTVKGKTYTSVDSNIKNIKVK